MRIDDLPPQRFAGCLIGSLPAGGDSAGTPTHTYTRTHIKTQRFNYINNVVIWPLGQKVCVFVCANIIIILGSIEWIEVVSRNEPDFVPVEMGNMSPSITQPNENGDGNPQMHCSHYRRVSLLTKSSQSCSYILTPTIEPEITSVYFYGACYCCCPRSN